MALNRLVDFRIVGPDAGIFPLRVDVVAKAKQHDVSLNFRFVGFANAVLLSRRCRCLGRRGNHGDRESDDSRVMI